MKTLKKKIIGIIFSSMLATCSFFLPKYIYAVDNTILLYRYIWFLEPMGWLSLLALINLAVSIWVFFMHPRSLRINFLVVLIWIMGQRWIF
jgi:hypothetical protein